MILDANPVKFVPRYEGFHTYTAVCLTSFSMSDPQLLKSHFNLVI